MGRTASASWSPIVWAGFSDVIGSWKMVPMRSAADPAQHAGGRAEQLLAVEAHGPAACALGRAEPEHGEHRHPLARARLADDGRPARPAATSRSTPRTASSGRGARRERDPQVADSQQRLGGTGHPASLTSKWSRRPSPRKLNAITTVKIATPGPRAIHHW